MSDLLSRSALIEEIKSLSIVLNGKQIFSDDAKDTVLRIINEQPTAYGIDKVVEKLEERKALYERLVGYESKNGTSTEKNQHIKAIDVLNDAIEIVKAGGKNE